VPDGTFSCAELKMIKVQALNENTLSIEIKGSYSEFEDDLSRFKNSINDRDRRYDEKSKRWIVVNPWRYRHLHWVDGALNDLEHQLELPGLHARPEGVKTTV
jgi:hypothetical protein